MQMLSKDKSANVWDTFFYEHGCYPLVMLFGQKNRGKQQAISWDGVLSL